MSKVLIKGITNLVWGVCTPKPIVGAPEGRQRLRLRKNDFARLFVKNGDSIRCFVLLNDGDVWKVDPQMEQGATYRPMSPNWRKSP